MTKEILPKHLRTTQETSHDAGTRDACVDHEQITGNTIYCLS